MHRSKHWLLLSALVLSGCGPKKLYETGLELARAGQLPEACGVFLEGKRRFPKYEPFLVSIADVCPQAMQSLERTADQAIARGDLGAARVTADRANRLLPLDHTARAIQGRVIAAHRKASLKAWESGREQQSADVAARLLSWRPRHDASIRWRTELLERVSTRSMDDAHQGRFPDAYTRLDLFQSLPDAAASLERTRDMVAAVEASAWLAEAEREASTGHLGAAWMLSRIAASRDVSRSAVADSYFSSWQAAQQVSIGLAPRDRHPRTQQIVAAALLGATTHMVRPGTGRSDVSGSVSRRAPACEEHVSTRPASHRYVAERREVTNPAWAARDQDVLAAAARHRDTRAELAAAQTRVTTKKSQWTHFQTLLGEAETEAAAGRALVTRRDQQLQAAQRQVGDAQALVRLLEKDAAEARADAAAVAQAEQAAQDARLIVIAARETVEETLATPLAKDMRRECEQMTPYEEARDLRDATSAAAARAKGAAGEAESQVNAAEARHRLLKERAVETYESVENAPDSVVATIREAHRTLRDDMAAWEEAKQAARLAIAEQDDAAATLRRSMSCLAFEEASLELKAAKANARAARELVEALRDGAQAVDPAAVRAARAALAAAQERERVAREEHTHALSRSAVLEQAREAAQASLSSAERGLARTRIDRDQAESAVRDAERLVALAISARDAVPPTAIEEVLADYPYMVEVHTRTCTARIIGSLTAQGRSIPLEFSSAISTVDEAWVGEPRVGLRGNALAYPSTDEAMADHVDKALTQAVVGELARRADEVLAQRVAQLRGGADWQQVDGMLLDWMRGAAQEQDVAALAQRLYGTGW